MSAFSVIGSKKFQPVPTGNIDATYIGPGTGTLLNEPGWYALGRRNLDHAFRHAIASVRYYQYHTVDLLDSGSWPSEWNSESLTEVDRVYYLERECLLKSCSTYIKEIFRLGRQEVKSLVLESFGLILNTIRKHGWSGPKMMLRTEVSKSHLLV